MAGRAGNPFATWSMALIGSDDQPYRRSSVHGGDSPHHFERNGNFLGFGTIPRGPCDYSDTPQYSLPGTSVYVGGSLERMGWQDLR